MVMEYANGGDLLSLLEKQREAQRFFSEKVLWKFAWQLWCGILHMHANGIIHRDIKAMNILINDGVLKIGDLGESRFLNAADYWEGKTVGTPLFLSPEMVKHDKYDHRVDIWALGCVMYHLATLKPPFPFDSLELLLKAILYKNPKPIQGWYSHILKDFIFKMLEKKRKNRPFISDLFNSNAPFPDIITKSEAKQSLHTTSYTSLYSTWLDIVKPRYL